jgi:hypothetical protein
MSENSIVKELRGIATKLASDPHVQSDVMHEMYLHLVRVRTVDPDRPLSWYLNSCEFHGRRYLNPLERADASLPDIVPGGDGSNRVDTHSPASTPFSADIEIQGERIPSDVLNTILPLLSEMQQQVLFLLMKGCGVREAGRKLGITHPAVIKHRKKIARIARELLPESEGVGVATAIRNQAVETNNGSANGNGESHAA